MVLKEWADLPVSIRSSRRKLWNYLVDELSSDNPEPTPVVETTNIAVSVDDGENAVEEATVVLTDTTDNTKTFTGTTGSAGGCTLSNVTFGTYTVTATCTGYENYTGAETLTVTSETTTLNISLTASTPAQEEVPGGE